MFQTEMFEQSSKKSFYAQEVMDKIEGLQYVENYITEIDEELLLSFINMQTWMQDLKRLVQHYGYIYNYKSRKIDKNMRIGDLPLSIQVLAEKLHTDNLMSYVADQVIVNQYLPGQGISKHIDCEPCFRDVIVSLSLGSSCIMEFSNKDMKIPVWLQPRSVVILKGAARYNWTHAIPSRKTDVSPGNLSVKRETRVSLTFRKVIL